MSCFQLSLNYEHSFADTFVIYLNRRNQGAVKRIRGKNQDISYLTTTWIEKYECLKKKEGWGGGDIKASIKTGFDSPLSEVEGVP